ncbi:hypothetical protein CRENBAI_008200 [Crenichthys baileyi]|uniref:Uncharacterized protein n=1 Tax=Crenichthys baileyi TaxID=28760 RepID=A0AAV9QPL3_9TELE
MYGEEVEVLPSPLLLMEMEELARPTPEQNADQDCSSQPVPVSSTSRRRRCHRQLSTTATASAEPSTSAAASAEPSTSAATTATTEFPVPITPYSLAFMMRVLRKGKVLKDLAIHLLMTRGLPEQTLEVLDQLRDWKAQWGRYSPSSVTVEMA